MTKPKPQKVERRLTSGNLWTIAVMVAGIIGGNGYQHFVPSAAASDAKVTATEAVKEASDAASRAAVLEYVVANHTEALKGIQSTVATLSSDVAVLRSQGDDAKQVAKSQSDKLDTILTAVSRLQGAQRATQPTGR